MRELIEFFFFAGITLYGCIFIFSFFLACDPIHFVRRCFYTITSIQRRIRTVLSVVQPTNVLPTRGKYESNNMVPIVQLY